MLTYAMAEPEGLSLGYFLRSLYTYLRTGAHCFRSGNDILAKALASALDVRCETRVEEILVDGRERVAGVRTSAGDIEASGVVSALPSPVLRGLYAGWTAEQREFFEGFVYSEMPLVLLEAEMREPVGYWGAVLDRRVGQRVSFVTYPHGKYRDACEPRFLQVWPMGDFGKELLELTDEEIGGAVLQELDRSASVDATGMKLARVVRYPHMFPQYRVEAFRKVLRFKASEGRPLGLYLAGDYTEGGMIEGAVRSGHNAAARVVAGLA
jgi:oxygen-dependent protoporphyrinogen oxidase